MLVDQRLLADDARHRERRVVAVAGERARLALQMLMLMVVLVQVPGEVRFAREDLVAMQADIRGRRFAVGQFVLGESVDAGTQSVADVALQVVARGGDVNARVTVELRARGE